MIAESLLLIAVALFSRAFYKWVTLNNNYFKQRNVKYMKPNFLVGNTVGMFLNKYTAIEFNEWMYNAFPNEAIYGMFDFRVPQFIVRSPEVIKKIGVKDFDNFEDHRAFTDEKTDKLWGNSLFIMKGEKWRQMRATLSPAFTGSKMRQMFELVTECADDLVKHFQKRSADGHRINVEMKDFFSRYTNDVIASCAFGLKINSLADPDNEFYVNGKKMMDFTGIITLFKIIIMNKIPALARALKIQFLNAKFAKTFTNLILETMEVRKTRNIYRPDMINILMQVREGKLTHSDEKPSADKEGFATVEESDVGKTAVDRKWNDDEIVAQCFLFFLAGFETASNLLTFTSYELVMNPDIQQKLYEEIVEMNDLLGGKRINYDALQKMKYLDQVICETLRKWPPALQVDRVCVKEYTYDSGDGVTFKVEKGTPFVFPIFGIQHDPQYFPEPNKFDPERFSDENKHKIVPGTFIAFGVGPRNCIGSRFALMEIKAILYYLLLNFSLEPNEESQIPVKLKKVAFSLLPEKGMHLELKPRQNSSSTSSINEGTSKILHKTLDELLLATGVALIAYAFYNLTTSSSRYFQKRNIKYTGGLSAIRNVIKVSLGKLDAIQLSQQMYNAFPDEPIYGTFDFSVRQYVARHPDAFKLITVKDFDHFENHRIMIDETMDPLWANNLFSMHDEKWRQMRATLSPAFTGSKMRQMFELVSECADDLVQHITKKAKNGEKINIETKDFFSRYANDVIATCAFGIKTNSFEDPENEFYMNGKKMFDFGGLIFRFKLVALHYLPKVARALNIQFLDKSISASMKSMILETMDVRKKNNIYRPDMINIMMQVRAGTLEKQEEDSSKDVQEGFATVEESEVGKANVSRKWNDNEVVAQCLLFFIAGFDTVSTALTFAAHELVVNPDIQQRLYEEIAEMNEQLNGKRIPYDALQKLKYLDQVICEILRKWPAAVQTDRFCSRDYVYDDGKLKFKIEKGSIILFPMLGMHRDPNYFPNPDKFDPERFSDENKHNIIPGSYFPFGLGPRNCIGSRFALMELKAILYYLLLNFSFEVNEHTQIPMKRKKGILLVSEKGVHVELKPRK